MPPSRMALLGRLLSVVAPASALLVGCDDGPGSPTGQTQQPGGGGSGAGAGAAGAAGSGGDSAASPQPVACGEEPAAKICTEGQFDGACVSRRCYAPGGDNPPGCLPVPANRSAPLSADLQRALGGFSRCYDDDTSRGTTGPFCDPKSTPAGCCYLVPQYLCEGRPLLVGGTARTAPIAWSADWLALRRRCRAAGSDRRISPSSASASARRARAAGPPPS